MSKRNQRHRREEGRIRQYGERGGKGGRKGRWRGKGEWKGEERKEEVKEGREEGRKEGEKGTEGGRKKGKEKRMGRWGRQRIKGNWTWERRWGRERKGKGVVIHKIRSLIIFLPLSLQMGSNEKGFIYKSNLTYLRFTLVFNKLQTIYGTVIA